MIIHSVEPLNIEPPSSKDISNITPSGQHYVRNHFMEPDVDQDNYVLELYFNDNKTPTATVKSQDIRSDRRFIQREELVTLQCAGNRRIEMEEHKPLSPDDPSKGLVMWKQHAIGTALYKGPLLSSFLKRYFTEPYISDERYHVEMTGHDGYAVSVPVSKASDTIIAHTMNSVILPHRHGGPLRSVVMGWYGARSVKWVRSIRLMDHESLAHSQKVEYIWRIGDLDIMPLNDMPVNSCILYPSNGQILAFSGTVTICGWAFAGGGRRIKLVQFSLDGGQEWKNVPPEYMSTQKSRYAWRIWQCQVRIPEKWYTKEQFTIACRAFDDATNTQPDDMVWNWKGYSGNGIHKITVYNKDMPSPVLC